MPTRENAYVPMLVDGIAHALEIAVEHARQDGRLEPLAHRGILDDISEKDGYRLAFGRRRNARLHAVGDEVLSTPAGASREQACWRSCRSTVAASSCASESRFVAIDEERAGESAVSSSKPTSAAAKKSPSWVIHHHGAHAA